MYAIILPPPPGLLNSTISSIKVSKSAQSSSSKNDVISTTSQWQKNILPKDLDPKCYTILEIFFDALQGPLSGHFFIWLSWWWRSVYKKWWPRKDIEARDTKFFIWPCLTYTHFFSTAYWRKNWFFLYQWTIMFVISLWMWNL